MKRLLSNSNGITEILHHDPETDTLTIETRSDAQAALDYTKSLANDSDYTRKGMKEGWLHYAYLPDSIILELKIKHGLNIYNPDHVKAVFKKINSEYPNLKTTSMHHLPKQ